jgi:hypothetical protein
MVDFACGLSSEPAGGGVIFVGKGPASGFPVVAGLYAFDTAEVELHGTPW